MEAGAVIDLHVRVTGGIVTYVAKQNETTTMDEIERMNELVNAIIKHMADAGMTGKAVNHVPKP